MQGRGPPPATPSAPSGRSPRTHSRGDAGGSAHTRWRPGTESPRCGVHHRHGRTRRRTAPPSPHLEAPHQDACGAGGSGTPLPCPLSAHPGAAVHPPRPPSKPVAARTRAQHCLSMCYAWGLGKAEHTVTTPVPLATCPRATAPPPAQRCRASPHGAQPSRQSHPTTPCRGTAPPQGPERARSMGCRRSRATPDGHRGCLRDASRTHRFPQCSLTAHCGVPPGARATCQRGPGHGGDAPAVRPGHASNPGGHARTRHPPPPEGGGSDGRVGRPLPHACSVHLSDCLHRLPEATAPPARRRCSTLWHCPLTNTEGSALSRWRPASPALLPALRRCTHTSHRDTGEGRTHVHKQRPLPEEDHRSSPIPRTSLRRHGPAAPATRGRTPRALAARAPPGGDACSSTALRRPEGTEPRAGRDRGQPTTPGRPGEHLLPRPGEAGSGQHRMQCLRTMPPPSSAGAPSRSPLPAERGRPCPTATPLSRTARTGGQGTRVPAPAPGAVYVSYVSHTCVCPLPALTHSLDPRPPWPPISALRQAPPAPRHALTPGEGPPGRAPAATPCGYGGSGAPGGPFPSAGRQVTV